MTLYSIYAETIKETINGLKRLRTTLNKAKESKKPMDETISTSSTADIIPVGPTTLVSVLTPECTKNKVFKAS